VRWTATNSENKHYFATMAAASSSDAAQLIELLRESRDLWKLRAEQAEERERANEWKARVEKAEKTVVKLRARLASLSKPEPEANAAAPAKRAADDDDGAEAKKPRKSATCSVCHLLLADKQCTERCKREKAKRKQQKKLAE
jgi:hypothetical protein